VKRKLLDALKGEQLWPPPIWLMRQAGRYLPEYRQVRASVGSFLDLCYTPALAAEVTLQPIRRYGFDAAILFSDILVVPDALGQEVRFLEGEGPRLDPIADAAGLSRLREMDTGEKFALVYETVQRLRQDLPPETTLIGFCGAPWTVATYMVGGAGSSDQAAARSLAYRDRETFRTLIDIVTDTSVEYLDGQIRAGADAVMIFDSWAGNLPDGEFDAWVVAPTCRIASQLKKRHPDVPIIGFPRAAGVYTEHFARMTLLEGLGCDTAMPLNYMRAVADRVGVTVQGNLDPLLLAAGGPALEARVRDILQVMRGSRFIFNLGHGIVPHTPPENVARLVEFVRAGQGVC